MNGFPEGQIIIFRAVYPWRISYIRCGSAVSSAFLSLWGHQPLGQISTFNITLAPEWRIVRSELYGAIIAYRRVPWLVPCAQPWSRTSTNLSSRRGKLRFSKARKLKFRFDPFPDPLGIGPKGILKTYWRLYLPPLGGSVSPQRRYIDGISTCHLVSTFLIATLSCELVHHDRRGIRGHRLFAKDSLCIERRRPKRSLCSGLVYRAAVDGYGYESRDRNRRSVPMGAETILSNVAILLLVATVWTYSRQKGRLNPARKTWLFIAGIFATIRVVLQLFCT